MQIAEIVSRYSVAARHLSGPCSGVVIHLLRVHTREGARCAGAVIDGAKWWLVPLPDKVEAEGFITRVAGAFYDMMEREEV